MNWVFNKCVIHIMINGSPHKGNTWKIAEMVKEKLQRDDKNAMFMEIASTTYFLRETSILKNLFDHLCFMTHRPFF